MEVLLGLLDWLQPTPIYAKLGDVIKIYTAYVVPTVLVFSLVSRYAELSVENLGQGAQWSDAIKDVKLAVILTGVYLSFGVILIKFHNAFAMLMYEKGSLGTVLASYQKLLDAAKAVAEDGDIFSISVGLTNMFTHKAVNWALFYLTFLALILVQVLLRVIYALGFCLLYLWGMAAVPTISSKIFNLSSGWLRSVITLALWPIIEATMIIFSDALFKGWGQVLLSNDVYRAELSMSGLYLLFSFCNVILIGVLVAGLVIAIMVASNQNMMTGLAAPVLAAGAAGMNLWKNLAMKSMMGKGSLMPTFKKLGGKGGGALKRMNERALPGLWNQFKQHTGLGGNGGDGGQNGGYSDDVLSNLDINQKGNGGEAAQKPDVKGPGM